MVVVGPYPMSEDGNPIPMWVLDNLPHLPLTLPETQRQSSRHDGFCWVGQGGLTGADLVSVYPGQQLSPGVWSLGCREHVRDQQGVHPLGHDQLHVQVGGPCV